MVKRKWKKWSEEEDRLIKENYPKIGLKVADMLPGRSYNAVRDRVGKLGLTRRQNPWTDEEIRILKEYYHQGIHIATKMLPAHSTGSICVKASALGLSKDREGFANAPNTWKKNEDHILLKYYPEEGKNVAKRLPRRSEQACAIRANSLGITFHGNDRRFWTEEEIEILETYYTKEGKRVSERLPGRSVNACQNKAHKMNLKYYAPGVDGTESKEQ